MKLIECKCGESYWMNTKGWETKCDKCGLELQHEMVITETTDEAKLQCSDLLVAELSLMVDIFNSYIETKKFPIQGSPCQKRIFKLLKQSGRKPTASK